MPGEYDNIAWNYSYANADTSPFFQGSGIGGGGAVNGMLWMHPASETLDSDYPPQFNASSLRPSFERLRRDLPLTQYPSTDGKQYGGSVGHLLLTALEQELGFKRRAQSPWSGREDIAGTGDVPYVVSAAGQRKNSATELLSLAAARKNTDVVVGVEVLQLVYERDGRVTGLEYRRAAAENDARASASASASATTNASATPTAMLRLRRGGRVVLAAGALVGIT